MPKRLIGQDASSRRFEYTDDAGTVVGYDTEPILSADQQREQAIRTKAAAALAANNTFLALASPTNAQVVQQVQRLTRENNALIRLVLQSFDADDA